MPTKGEKWGQLYFSSETLDSPRMSHGRQVLFPAFCIPHACLGKPNELNKLNKLNKLYEL
jgi:hypothetical protein